MFPLPSTAIAMALSSPSDPMLVCQLRIGSSAIRNDEFVTKTINNNLDSIRCFYNYLQDEEDISIDNPVKTGYALRLSKPLPKHLKD